MSATWKGVPYGPWSDDQEVPHEVPDAGTIESMDLPRTLRPVPGAAQALVFDPALKHRARALRPGEPRFASAETGERWYAARRRAIDHVLAAIAGSGWAGNLVLRGSVLLRAWYGPAAREPGDLDFVVVPADWAINDRRTGRMLDQIARDADEISRRDPDGEVRLNADGAVSEDIWTYERVPGRRLVLPWRAEGLPEGSVQLDFVFNEHLPAAPEPTEIPRSDGGEPVSLNAATPELSLAWKLVWLVDDMYPQGKDLYDAWLLAQHARPSHRLLADTFVALDPAWARRPPTLATITGLEEQADWEEFRKDYPSVRGTAADYARMLAKMLAPVFAVPSDLPEHDYERRAVLLGPRIAVYRTLLEAEGMPAVQRRMLRDELAMAEAAVITNELLGRDEGELGATAQAVLDARTEAGSREAAYYVRNPHQLAESLGLPRR